ncbi:uncharacterized protein [Nicotiana sylvestris]|uniref:uncharacterized protein n=1 Tax=Nicotiana sylvestris TaxID=4096 RepID=UPI00388CADF0
MANDNGNPSATVGATTIASSSRTVVPSAEKPGKFSGANFKGWQQRVFFWLTTLGMQKFTSEEPPVPVTDMPDNENTRNTSKELWDTLEKKYKTEVACLKKFVVSKFLDYEMIDNKTVGTQVQELQLIFHDLIAEGMVVNEAFQVAAMIEKLPPSWRVFKNYLKHKRKEMKLEDLVIRLKIEEDNKTVEKKSRGNSTIWELISLRRMLPKVGRGRDLLDKPRSITKKKIKGNCYNCRKIGHKSPDCRLSKKDNKKGQVNIMEKNDDIDDLCVVLSECNLVGNLNEWWIDFGAT